MLLLLLKNEQKKTKQPNEKKLNRILCDSHRKQNKKKINLNIYGAVCVQDTMCLASAQQNKRKKKITDRSTVAADRHKNDRM